jgi:hypothetical protein
MENSNQERIRKTISFGKISVSRVYENNYKPEFHTAELKQTVTTKSYYPSKSVNSDKQDNLFGTSEFGLEEQEYETTETRVAWMNVPIGTTVEQVEARLKQAPEAVLMKSLSYTPILSSDQIYAIQQGLRTKDDFAKSQAVRLPENEATIADGTAGKLALHEGNVQYRQVFFKLTKVEDEDLRTPDNIYAPEELLVEAGILNTDLNIAQ